MLGLQYLGIGGSIHLYLRSSFLSPLAKPQAKLQRVWWGSLKTLNTTSDHFYVPKNVATWKAVISGLSKGELKCSALSGSSWFSLSSANQMPFKPAVFSVKKWSVLPVTHTGQVQVWERRETKNPLLLLADETLRGPWINTEGSLNFLKISIHNHTQTDIHVCINLM